MTQVSFVDKTKKVGKNWGGRTLAVLQKVGKSLVFPIAVLPAAAILMRMGELIKSYGSIEDGAAAIEQFAYWIGVMIATPGNAVFNNLPAIFAIGVGFGFSKDKRGEAALVSFITYMALHMLVDVETTSLANMIYSGAMVNSASGMSDLLYLTVTATDPYGEVIVNTAWVMNTGVFGGIAAGLLTAWVYNKYSEVRLHPALGFFSGRRFVPLVALLVVIPFSIIMALIWPWFNYLLVLIAEGITYIPALGAGIYATLNRLLIPFGLHQVLNSYFWFQMPVQGQVMTDLSPLVGMTSQAVTDMGVIVLDDGGDGIIDVYDEVIVFGDITAFSYGVEGAGVFQVGFYPIMMFGLPAVGFAIAKNADNEHKKAVWAFMLSAAAVAFLTGVTEPLEFAFAFVAPLLYLAYAIISGFVAAAVVATGALSGFGFSAGLIDLAISSPMAAALSTGAAAAGGGWMHLGWIVIIGVLSMPVYYFTVDFAIRKWDIATPGRNGNLQGVTVGNDDDFEPTKAGKHDAKFTKMAEDTIALVGADNIKEVDNCITRVRLTVKDNSHITREAAQKIKYQGYVKTGTTQAHFIIGPESEIIANEITRLLKEGYTGKTTPKKTSTTKKPAAKKPVDLNSKTVSQLKDMAKRKKITGYSTMTKPQLIKALK